jgi:hypothetical protein
MRRATAAPTYNEIIGLLRPFISNEDPQVKHWVWNSAEWLDWLTHNSDRFLKLKRDAQEEHNDRSRR